MSASLRLEPGASYRRYARGDTLRVLLQYTGITVVDYVTFIKLHRDITYGFKTSVLSLYVPMVLLTSIGLRMFQQSY
jgi:hypothetical protein